MDFSRNNLDTARSPYLRQHKDNPIWWQEWSEQTLAHARTVNKIIFVSVGYATCHWCHVMAHDTFSDRETADYLNEHFVSIKVDREQRPDIDRYLMNYLLATAGSGGWPLNAFLTPQIRPFFATTYVGSRARSGMPAFRDMLAQIVQFYQTRKAEIREFRLPEAQPHGRGETDPIATEGELHALIDQLYVRFDSQFAGFGSGQKFPPHTTLLYLLYHYVLSSSEPAEEMLTATLDQMQRRGLHDHLGGGFFRYTVDRQWTIPHFEKMLYDQAMLLWVYSTAARVFDNDGYAKTAAGIYRCLETSFYDNGLYVSGHDADTGGKEGATYLWSDTELQELLTPVEREQLFSAYEFQKGGNMDGLHHLVRKPLVREDTALTEIEEKLYSRRNTRAQPETDTKHVTSWNCLTGIALLHYWRHVGNVSARERAREVAVNLMERHHVDGILVHSSFQGELQREEFLEDYAAFLLFLTYLEEEFGGYGDLMREVRRRLEQFRTEHGWMESSNQDFMKIPAESFDHPSPASVSLAEFAILRVSMLTAELYDPIPPGTAGSEDFHNLASLASRGWFYVIETPERLPWDQLPVPSVQVPGEQTVTCRKGLCTPGLP